MVATKKRTIESLLLDLKEIEEACLGAKDEKESKLDSFQKAKLNLSEILDRLKADIEFCEKNRDGGGEAVRAKMRAQKDFPQAEMAKAKLEKALQKNEKDFSKKRKKALQPDEIEERREVYMILTKDFNFVSSKMAKTENVASDIESGAAGERQRRIDERKQKFKKRRKGRRNGSDSDEEVDAGEPPLNEQEQAFLQRSILKDREIDKELDVVHKKLRGLNEKTKDIGLKVKEKGEALNELEGQFDTTTQKLENTSEQLNRLLEASGGLKQWVPMIIVGICIFFALAYMVTLIT